MKNYKKFLKEHRHIPEFESIIDKIKNDLTSILSNFEYKEYILTPAYTYIKDGITYDIKIKIILNFTNSNSEKYDGNINYLNIVKNGLDKTIITINIESIEPRIEKILESISHELTHLYELEKLKDFDYSSWSKSTYLIDSKKQNSVILFMFFRELVYFSFEHEIRAKIAGMHEYLLYMWKNNKYDKTEFMNFLKNSNSYNNCVSLENFNADEFVNNFILFTKNGLEFLIYLTNEFNKYFKIKTTINTKEELEIYYKKWEKKFKKSGKEFKKKLYDIFYEVIKENKFEKNVNYVHESFDIKIEQPIYEKFDEMINNMITTFLNK